MRIRADSGPCFFSFVICTTRMGNSQSQNSSAIPASRRYAKPKSTTNSPRRSSSLRSSNRPQSPASKQQPPPPSAARPARPIRVHHSLRQKKKSLELPDLAPSSPAQTIPITSPSRLQPPLSSSPTSISASEIVEHGSNKLGDNLNPGNGYQPIVVRSSIPFPLNLQKIEAQASATPPALPSWTSLSGFSDNNRINPRASEGEAIYLVKITWRGGGDQVFLVRAGDDDWNGRQNMDRELPASAADEEGAGGGDLAPVFATIISLPRGTHHLRFLVDGQQRVADDLPTAVDDNGSLANYVAVGLGDIDPESASDSSSGSHPELAELAFEGDVETAETTPRPTEVTSFTQIQGYPRVESHSSFWNDNNSEPPSLSSSPTGTGVIAPMTPLTNVANSTTKAKSKTKTMPYERKWTREIPLELLEAATEEETYLAYQNEVENAHASGHRHVTGFVPLPNIPPAPRLPRHLEKLILNSPALPSTPKGPGSPASSSATSRVNSPKSPNSSLNGQQITRPSSRGHGGGSGSGNYAALGPGGLIGERTIRTPERERHSPSREGRRREREWKSMAMAMDEGTAQEDEREKEGEKEKQSDEKPGTDRPLPVTTASGTNVLQVTQGRPKSPTLPSMPETRPSFPDFLTIADDTSVLPVPSHVVLHHLCTSAIKNGMLAVGGTVRYRKKFVTTIYYKPAS
ncbi:hypothetical protein D9757_007026 [Collybiopsis confluens]|uniref:Association with the SNF1 complex (ASC) domain-containing protein n=1 Tax=Collybiopsis confluens TaxID=2823264 RepID=A0A8H5M491_9AGAR|nr:hypothetical protein D9757_007026 [Collybiopsis confluens]